MKEPCMHCYHCVDRTDCRYPGGLKARVMKCCKCGAVKA